MDDGQRTKLRKQLAGDLDNIVLKALRKEPERRYASVEAFSEDIRRHLEGLPVIARKDTLAYRTVKFIKRNKVGMIAAALTAVVLITLVAVGLSMLPRQDTTAEKEIKSLAVLPLENLSGDPQQEYFADGMTDALIGDLAKIGALRVISRTSAMHYKGTKKSLPQIASELGVDAVVEGTVQRSGDHVLIRVQLIHAATDRHLWVNTYERDLREVLKLQSEVTRAIAREIQTKVTPAEQARLAHHRPVNRQAYDDYLQGRYLYSNQRTEENLRKAIEYFQSAIKQDSGFALAYAGLADCYNVLGTVMFSGLPPTEARRRAEEAAEKALEFDSGLAEAHVALGVAKHYIGTGLRLSKSSGALLTSTRTTRMPT